MGPVYANAAAAAAAAAIAPAPAPTATIPTGVQHITTMLSASQARAARLQTANAAAAAQATGSANIIQGDDGQSYAVINGQVRQIHMANRRIRITHGETAQARAANPQGNRPTVSSLVRGVTDGAPYGVSPS